jgi:hypothetical protein
MSLGRPRSSRVEGRLRSGEVRCRRTPRGTVAEVVDACRVAGVEHVPGDDAQLVVGAGGAMRDACAQVGDRVGALFAVFGEELFQVVPRAVRVVAKEVD